MPKADEQTPERTPERIRSELRAERTALERAVGELRDQLKQAGTLAASGTFALGGIAFVAKRLLRRRRS